MTQRTVDVHNHYYPKEYIEYLADRSTSPRMKQTGPNSYVAYAGDIIVAHIDRPGHYDLAARVKDLDAAGLDVQILSKTIPGPEMLERDDGVYWAARVNDALTKAVEDYPGRFYALATLPYQDIDAACKELERCYKELKGFVGIQMFSNINGDPVFIEKYHPIYQMANDWELPILMHPTVPLTGPVMEKVRIPFQLYGYTLDTTMAIISCIFNGVFEKYPKLTMIHAHLGGMVPYMVQRLKHSWKGYAKEWGLSLSEDPDITYKTRVYPDTTSFYLPAMKCCLEWVGPGQMGIGTDYAHRVGDPEGAVKAVKNLGEQAGLSQEEIDMILGKNMEKLFKLPPANGK